MLHKASILTLCGIKENLYTNRFLDAGRNFILWNTHNDALCDEFLSELKAFWGWWEREWNQREAAFVKEYANSRIASDRLYVQWKKLHEPENVVAQIPLAVLKESWDTLMSEAWTERHRVEAIKAGSRES
jgi:hypothetical protein